jgi:Mg2+ and Co2+ transporter CorA
VLEDWQDDIDHFEQNCLNNTSGQMLSEILRFKKLVTQLRHSFNKVFRDQRRLLIACPETYLSAGNRAQLSQAINRLGGATAGKRIMERLAIVTSIFMPLTFIVGVYGMNIPDMPELHFQGFYFALWAVMLSIAGGLLYFFKKLRWY